MKVFKCPFCPKRYSDKQNLLSHIVNVHTDMVPRGMSVGQFYFNIINKKRSGKCIICSKETKWNESAQRYDRICCEKCQKEFRELFKKRMMKKHGTFNMCDNPEHQKKMLANRKISGKYKWSDNSKEFTYTGTYERDFLEFMDIFMNWNSSDIMSPAPQIFNYMYEGKKRFYIPDFYIPSLNLIIEVKSDTNKHYRQRDIEIEKIKDKILKDSKFNYFKVLEKEYDDFYNFLLNNFINR